MHIGMISNSCWDLVDYTYIRRASHASDRGVSCI